MTMRDKRLLCAALALMLAAGCCDGYIVAADKKAAQAARVEAQEPIRATALAEVVETVQAAPLAEETAEPAPATEEELTILAQIVWAEARGVSSTREQAAVIWCVLNRVDAGFGGSIKSVATAPHQFAWSRCSPAPEEFVELARDVCTRWADEKAGTEDVGRVLPPEYLYFGGDGEKNYFRDSWRHGNVWDWSLPDPYEEGQK